MNADARYAVTLERLDPVTDEWVGSVRHRGTTTHATTWGDLTPRGAARRMVSDRFDVDGATVSIVEVARAHHGRVTLTLEAKW